MTYKEIFQLAVKNGYKLGSPVLYHFTNWCNGSDCNYVAQADSTWLLDGKRHTFYSVFKDFLKRINIDDDNILLELTLISKWLRDTHGIDIEIFNQYSNAGEGKWYAPKILYPTKTIGDNGRRTLPTVQQCGYERAFLEGIHEALKLI